MFIATIVLSPTEFNDFSVFHDVSLLVFFCIFFFSSESVFSIFFPSYCEITHTKFCMEARTLNIFCLYTWITNETNDFQPFPYNIIELNTLSDALLYESRVYNCVANNYGSRPNMQLETYARHNVYFALFLCVWRRRLFRCFFQLHWITRNKNSELKN